MSNPCKAVPAVHGDRFFHRQSDFMERKCSAWNIFHLFLYVQLRITASVCSR